MKAILAFFAITFAQAAYADLDEAKSARQFLVHQSQTIVPVDINERTVLCLAADYQSPVLKILVPQLAQLTLLNHQNTGAGAPCLTTNESCLPTTPGRPPASPEDIIKGRPGRDNVFVVVREFRQETIDQTEGVCHVNLLEQVGATIRGKNFTHQRVSALTDRPISDCAK